MMPTPANTARPPRRAQTNFTAGSATRRAGHYAPVQPDDKPVPINTDPDEVPVGTAREVLRWVGTDRDRASRALAAEDAGERRKVLVATLAKLAGRKAAVTPAHVTVPEPPVVSPASQVAPIALEPPAAPEPPVVIVPPATHVATPHLEGPVAASHPAPAEPEGDFTASAEDV